MSIVTRTGDNGTTGLMYNRRVPKTAPRVEAYGAIDELNTALGMARAVAVHDFVGEHLRVIQNDLITVMGEVATVPEDRARYEKDGYPLATNDLVDRLDRLVKEIEAQNPPFKGWATPGENLSSAALEVARTACRRAEREVCKLEEAKELGNPMMVVFLNRLSDTLWLLARWVDHANSKNSPSTE